MGRMTWIVLLVVVSLAAVALTLLGLRGRRADDHPLCRKCGFDQTGNPGAKGCTECGADLTRKKAVKIGHRARRKGPLVAGLALLVACLLVGGIVGYVVIRGVDVQAHKPAWLLARELRSTDDAARDAAVAELERRLNQGELSPAAASTLVDWALDQQADRSLTWDPRWGGLVETARRDKAASDAQWKRYARQGLVPLLAVRPSIRQGDPLPMEVSVDRRTGPAASWQMYLTVENLAAAGRPVGAGSFAGGMAFTPMGSAYSFYAGTQLVPGQQTDAFDLGPAQATARVQLVIGEYQPRGNGWNAPVSAEAVSPLVRDAVELSASFDVLGRDAPPGFVTTDESLRPKVEARVWVSPLRWVSEAAAAADTGLGAGGVWIVGVRETGAGPSGDAGAPLGYDPFLRLPDGTDLALDGNGLVYGFGDPKLGPTSNRGFTTASLAPDTRSALQRAAAALGVGGRPKTADGGPAPQAVTIVLRPDVESAKMRLDGRAVWGREVVFENVPVSREARDAAGHDWRTGPWQSPGGEVVDPDAAYATLYGKATASNAPASRPASQPAP